MNRSGTSEHSAHQRRPTDWALLAVPLLVYLIVAWPLRGWIIDDAGITFAYARSLAFGHGLVAQPGVPPVEGYSNLLWLLLMLPFFWLHLFDPYMTSKIVSAALVGLSFWYMYRTALRLTGGNRLVGLAALLLPAFNTSFVVWTCSGLENPLFAALIALLIWRLVDGLDHLTDMKSAAVTGLIAAGIALTRPDGIIYFAAFPGALLLSRAGTNGWFVSRLKAAAVYAGMVAVTYGGYLLFRHWYFGAWLPNTYYAKGGPQGRSVVPALTLGLEYAEKFRLLMTSLLGSRMWILMLLVLVVGLTIGYIRHRRRRQLSLLVGFLFAGYFVHMIMPNDWMGEFRFATPFFLLMYLLLVLAASYLLELIASPLIRRATTAVVLLLALSTAFAEQAPRLRAFYKSPPASFAGIRKEYVARFDRWANNLGLHSVSVLLPDVGAPLYYSKYRVYDLGRLTDRVIARTLYINNAAFHDYVFETIRPTFIHTHGSWTNRARLDDDPRFRRDYLAIKEWPDKWVKNFNGRDMMSGDYVRRDAVIGREELLRHIDDVPPQPGGRRPDESLTLIDARREPQGFVELTGKSLPNTRVDVDYAIGYHPPLDADSIKMIEYAGGLHYQPVEMAHRCYHFMAAYLVTKDPHLLERTGKYVRKMAVLADTLGDASFIPYGFDKRVHRNLPVVLHAPWYSGMAQGEALGVTMRLWELTGDEQYRQFGDRLFNSITHTRGEGGPWVSRVDSNGYFWIEEYPDSESPGMTLNGYIAAIYGVYDYYRLTKKDSARVLYDACLTTLKHYLPEYRRPGQFSFYCLGHHEPANESYHHLHISMLNHLARMTGDDTFSRVAEDFLKDSGPRKTD